MRSCALTAVKLASPDVPAYMCRANIWLLLLMLMLMLLLTVNGNGHPSLVRVHSTPDAFFTPGIHTMRRTR